MYRELFKFRLLTVTIQINEHLCLWWSDLMWGLLIKKKKKKRAKGGAISCRWMEANIAYELRQHAEWAWGHQAECQRVTNSWADACCHSNDYRTVFPRVFSSCSTITKCFQLMNKKKGLLVLPLGGGGGFPLNSVKIRDASGQHAHFNLRSHLFRESVVGGQQVVCLHYLFFFFPADGSLTSPPLTQSSPVLLPAAGFTGHCENVMVC